MSHLGARPKSEGGNCPCPNVEPPLILSKQYHFNHHHQQQQLHLTFIFLSLLLLSLHHARHLEVSFCSRPSSTSREAKNRSMFVKSCQQHPQHFTLYIMSQKRQQRAALFSTINSRVSQTIFKTDFLYSSKQE